MSYSKNTIFLHKIFLGCLDKHIEQYPIKKKNELIIFRVRDDGDRPLYKFGPSSTLESHGWGIFARAA